VNELDPAIAFVIASAFERVAQELRSSAGIKLALLRDGDAECRPRADAREKRMLMTANEVAQALNIHARTVRRLWRAGKLPAAIEVGTTVRWRRRDIERYVEEQRAR
jgi:excisionase family DNA binding protein